jgi:broad specificity phosphatase PhoE
VTKLLLVRHGETDWNRDGRWQGGSDTRLNDLGREQARALAEQLDGDIDVLYSSDLARARETAEIVAAKLGLEVRLDPRLRERGFGSWEGLTMPEIEERFAESHRRWRSGEEAQRSIEFRRRALTALAQISAASSGPSAERATSAPILMRKGFRDIASVQIWMAV